MAFIEVQKALGFHKNILCSEDEVTVYGFGTARGGEGRGRGGGGN